LITHCVPGVHGGGGASGVQKNGQLLQTQKPLSVHVQPWDSSVPASLRWGRVQLVCGGTFSRQSYDQSSVVVGHVPNLSSLHATTNTAQRQSALIGDARSQAVRRHPIMNFARISRGVYRSVHEPRHRRR
jgi:hypothetical protein